MWSERVKRQSNNNGIKRSPVVIQQFNNTYIKLESLCMLVYTFVNRIRQTRRRVFTDIFNKINTK